MTDCVRVECIGKWNQISEQNFCMKFCIIDQLEGDNELDVQELYLLLPTKYIK